MGQDLHQNPPTGVVQNQEDAQKEAAERVFVGLVETIAKKVVEDVLKKTDTIADLVDDALDRLGTVTEDQVVDIVDSELGSWGRLNTTVSDISREMADQALMDLGVENSIDDLESRVSTLEEDDESGSTSDLEARIDELESRLDNAEIRI